MPSSLMVCCWSNFPGYGKEAVPYELHAGADCLPLDVPHFCKLHCECTVKECGDQRAQFTVVLYILEELDFTCRLGIFSFLLICIDQQGEFLLYSMID